MECSGSGVEVDPVTLATSLEGVFAGGDAVLGPDLAVRAVAAGRRAAGSIDRYLRKLPLVPERVAFSTFDPIDEQELAKLFRQIEHGERAETARLDPALRLTSFEEVDGGLVQEAVLPETRRCMTCGCSKADGCSLRNMATEYGADANRFGGPRRRFEQDHSHPDILYEPGKCIACDACVRVARAEGEPLGLTLVGRGFEVAVAAPFGEALSNALSRAAVLCAEVCPTGALSLRRNRACESCFVPMEEVVGIRDLRR
jgi:ferredoxin